VSANKYTEIRFSDEIDIRERYVAALMVLADEMEIDVEEAHEAVGDLLDALHQNGYEIDVTLESEETKEGRKYH